jgi:hypothetical protein
MVIPINAAATPTTIHTQFSTELVVLRVEQSGDPFHSLGHAQLISVPELEQTPLFWHEEVMHPRPSSH